jgi:Ca2+-binding EF-hand superfamily protein
MRLFTITAGLGILGIALLRTGSADDKTPTPPTAKPALPDQAKSPNFNAERFLKDHDTNKDGKLSKDELPPGLRDSFAEIDTNKDGFATKDELQAYADRMAHQRPQMIEIVYYSIDVPEPEADTLKELQQTYDVLRKLDVNKDGKIDAKELAAYREARRTERVDSIFKLMDTNKDGKISHAEARGLWADDFKELDTNGDGFLDRAEVEKALMTPKTNEKDKPAARPEK